MPFAPRRRSCAITRARCPRSVPPNATQRAVLAIEVHDEFLRHDPVTNRPTVFDPDPEVIRVEVRRRTRQSR